MKKEVEDAENWFGKGTDKENKKALIRTRSFMDNMTSLINLCIYKENRVLDIKE